MKKETKIIIVASVLAILLAGAGLMRQKNEAPGKEVKTPASLSPENQKEFCRSFEANRYINEDLSAPVPTTCSFMIDPRIAPFKFVFNTSTLEIWRDGKNIQTFSDLEIRLVDITYDGYPDIEVLVDAGAYNATYSYFPYDPIHKKFSEESIIDAVNPDIDAEKHEIVSYSKGRGIGDIYTLKTYRFISGDYILVREEGQDIVDFLDSSSEYIRTVKELRNGAMVEIERKKITDPYEGR